jgi:hypothetical protein
MAEQLEQLVAGFTLKQAADTDIPLELDGTAEAAPVEELDQPVEEDVDPSDTLERAA